MLEIDGGMTNTYSLEQNLNSCFKTYSILKKKSLVRPLNSNCFKNHHKALKIYETNVVVERFRKTIMTELYVRYSVLHLF